MCKSAMVGGALALFVAAGSALAVTPRIISATPITDDMLPQTRANNTVIFAAMDAPFFAAAAAAGNLGFDDYDSTFTDFSFAHLQTFGFVGGVTAAGGVMQVQFYDINDNIVNFFDIALPQAGNFIWDIGLETAENAKDSVFAIPADGYIQLATVGGVTGQFFLSPTLPTVGTESRAAGEGSTTLYSHRFQLATFGGTNTAPNLSLDPAISGQAAPGLFDRCGGASVITVTIDDPGTNPAGTDFAVTADTINLGGGIVNLLDDGVAPDALAGDLTFTTSVNVPPGNDAQMLIPIAITFNRPNPEVLNAQFALDRDNVGGTIATAAVRGGDLNNRSVITGYTAGGGDVEMYTIFIEDPNNFSASLVGGAAFDTQLFLFGPTGEGLLFNDDDATSFQSEITLQIIDPADLGPGGKAFLALTAWGNDALDAAAVEIWLDEPYDVTRAPDGGSADNILAAFTNAGDDGGNYTITMTGAVTPCLGDLADENGNAGPNGGVDINDLLFFLVQFEAGSQLADVDNGSGTGIQDCGTDINDLLFFLQRFEGGC